MFLLLQLLVKIEISPTWKM